MHPMFESCNVLPPSSDRKMQPFMSASTEAQTRCGFTGDTVTPIFPRFDAGRPAVSLVQVSPPSVDLYSPAPGPVLVMFHGVRSTCHVDAYSTRLLDGSIAMSAAPVSSSTNNTFCQLLPPSPVRNTPRSALGPYGCPIAATYTISGFVGLIRIRPI